MSLSSTAAPVVTVVVFGEVQLRRLLLHQHGGRALVVDRLVAREAA